MINMRTLRRNVRRDWELMIFSVPLVIYFLVFHYWPMYGVLIAFKNFSPNKGILGSAWAGSKYFMQVFNSPYLFRLMRNTFLLGFYGLLWGFPIPILFALMLNEVKCLRYKKVVQTVSYLPYFISTVIIVGLMFNFFSPNSGVINTMRTRMTGQPPINFMGEASWFRTLYIGSGIWQTTGWDSIIYLAALSGIDMELYDSAKVDGCNRFQSIWHITLPGIRNTMMILFILRVGSIMSVGFEKIILMYSPSTYEVADVVATYTYRKGILDAKYSFGAAFGLVNSVINIVFLFSANAISRKLAETSLW
jgi:putative aldouronate transport system permease protein